VAAVTVWRFVEFVLTSLIFILVGLQLRAVLERIADRGILELATLALAISATLILARFAWVWPAAWLPVLIPGVHRREGTPRHRELLVLSWAGMRGVVSLAAALALPANFPERDLLVFLAFAAILATLVLQGTTLGMVARRARVEERRVPGMDPVEAALRNQVAGAMAAEVARRSEDLLEGPIARDLLAEYQDKARIFSGLAGGAGPAEMRARLTIRLAALKAGRARLLAVHREGGLPDELLAALENEQDLEELRIRRLLGAPEPAR
jgi:CPA1 family monovalent cation:H+ antiporter